MGSSIRFRRTIILVLDSLGIGALPDADKYDDQGSNTLKHLEDKLGALKIPNLARLGMSEIADLQKTERPKNTAGFFSRMKEASKGKDTTTGHWEMMGMPLIHGLSLFPNGFSKEILAAFKAYTGLDCLGNKPASGTEIIDELGEEHLKTGKPIVYTSADSVFQIAWHEEKYGLERLYEICEISRKLLDESSYKVGRVIARPFIGTPGSFKRTGNRRDFSLTPDRPSALDHLKRQGLSVIGVGKIPYIFDFRGITQSLEAHNDDECLEVTLKALKEATQPGVIFTNLNDLDMIYGHRRNIEGYARQLEKLDQRLNDIFKLLKSDDLLLITADHGNDTTHKGTDHTREFVPLLAYSPSFGDGPVSERRLTDRETFSDLGQTLVENFGASPIPFGKSFLSQLES